MVVTIPNVEWVQFSTDTDPSGFRHLQSTGFVKTLGTAPGESLDFGAVNTTTSGAISDTKLVLARVSSFGDASGVFNMRFFLVNTSAFSEGRFRFLESKQIHFQGADFSLNEGNNDTSISVPTNPNVISTLRAGLANGQGVLSGILDQDTTQYIYLAVLVDSDVPVGLKGGAGLGSFRYRMAFDFS